MDEGDDQGGANELMDTRSNSVNFRTPGNPDGLTRDPD